MSSSVMSASLQALSDEGWHCIFETDVWPPNEHVVDISPRARPGHFRLIDCAALVYQKKLKILESGQEIQHSWSRVPYAVASYIWRGRPVDQVTAPSNLIRIKGAEDGDPISVDVLRTVCEASLLGVPPPVKYHPLRPLAWTDVPRADLLWLDQLCISQQDETDKSTQIANMYGVYSGCAACFIIPGGLRRLVPLDEETVWTHRAWTLQECVAPSRTFVIFSWPSGKRLARLMDKNGNWTMSVLPIDSQGALADFKGTLRACTFGPLRVGLWSKPGSVPAGDYIWTDERVTVNLFGKYDANLFALFTVLEDKSSYVDRKIRHGLIWRCALTRTSSRPVDMVFSIMGLLGVQLQPKNFHKQDRLGATIALITAILDNGDCADWLGIMPSLRPSHELSTFPVFPDTQVTGEVTVDSVPFSSQASQWIFEEFSRENESPPDSFDRIRGRVDEVGYVIFRRKACPVVEANLDKLGVEELISIFKAEDGKLRKIEEGLDLNALGYPRTVVVPLWSFTIVSQGGYQELDLLMAYDRRRVHMFMVLKEHSRGLFHVVTYWMEDAKSGYWNNSRVNKWEEMELAVGGPRPRMVRTSSSGSIQEVKVPDRLECSPQ